MPVTGSLISPTVFSCRDADFTDRSSRYWIVCDKDWVLPAGYQVLLQNYAKYWTMDVDGFSIVDNRAGVTFGVVPWNAPEMAVDLDSAGTVPLWNVPDDFGMIGRHNSATESHILQGRDVRSIRVLIPDSRGLDQNFHDVTVVDMGDMPESHVSITELSDLTNKWPPAVINHMLTSRQSDNPGSRMTFCCSAISACRWYTITGYTRGASHM